MFDQLTPEQTAELFQYFIAEPFGEYRQDMRHAAHMSLYFNAHRGRGRPRSQGEFMLYRDEAETAKNQNVAATINRAMETLARRQRGN